MQNFDNLTNEQLVAGYKIAVGAEKEQYLERLLQNNLGLINQCASQFANIPNSEHEDRVSELYIELVKAVEDFDPSQGNKLTTVLKTYFVRRMKRLYEDATYQKRDSRAFTFDSYEVLVETKSDGEVEGGSMVLDYDSYADVEVDIMLSELGLSENEYLTCTLYLEGETKSDIARTLGVSPTMVNKYFDSIRNKFQMMGLAGAC